MKKFIKKSISSGLNSLLMIALITLSAICNSQSLIQKQLPEQDATCLLESFTIKQIEQKNYLNWEVRSTLSNYYFVLDKSSDGKNFSTVCIKKGVVSPANKVLLFCFMEGADNSPKTVYKLSAYKTYLPEKGTQVINLNEKNIFDKSEKTIIEVNNEYQAFLLPQNFSSK